MCRYTKQGKNQANLVLREGRHAFVMMNRFPYNNGHLMVVPKRHCLDLDELDGEEFQELSELLRISAKILKLSLRPQGFNIGINIGKVGGAGEEHIHFHIVPRWAGDTNFMPVLGETKVIPEYLSETYQRLLSAFEKYFSKRKPSGED